jgi:hypothetical protein
VFLIKGDLNKQYRLIQKIWDSEYDCKRFSSGIYNLDRLCIKTKSVQLSAGQEIQCKNLLDDITTVPEQLEREGYIVLDGIDYELTIKNNYVDKEYKWRIPTNDIRLFAPLIDFLTTKIVD